MNVVPVFCWDNRKIGDRMLMKVFFRIFQYFNLSEWLATTGKLNFWLSSHFAFELFDPLFVEVFARSQIYLAELPPKADTCWAPTDRHTSKRKKTQKGFATNIALLKRLWISLTDKLALLSNSYILVILFLSGITSRELNIWKIFWG